MGRIHPALVPGGIYHVTARGNNRAAIFLDEFDYLDCIRQLAKVIAHCDWLCLAFCLMPNHYHLLVETPLPNLADGMHLLNGRHARRFNARHERAGHLFQGPYHAESVERDEHLLESCRYIALNPVRAGLVEEAADWPWSSFGGDFSFVDREALCSLFGTDAEFYAFVTDGAGRLQPG
jgi:REP element-mobilizing transposase RayT